MSKSGWGQSYAATSDFQMKYKASVLGELLPAKKSLFDKCTSEGVAIKGINLTFGPGCTYDFAGGKKEDKVAFKDKQVTVVARHGKNDKVDITVTKQVDSNLAVTLKTENLGKGTPDYSLAAHGQCTRLPIKGNMKFHPSTFVTKGSAIMTVAGARVGTDAVYDPRNAGDAKKSVLAYQVALALNPMEGMKLAGLYNSKSEVLVYASQECKKCKAEFGAEVGYVASGFKGQVGVSKKVCGATVTAKLNSDLMFGYTVKQALSPNCTVQSGSHLNLADPLSLLSTPKFGFAITLKQ